MSKIPLSQLPEPQIVTPDYQGTLTRLKKNYETGTGHYPLVSDPETFLLEQTAYERELIVDDINREAKQNLLAFANDAMLDHLGALVDCPRLPASPALTTLQLTLSSPHPALVLQAGITVRAVDGETVFSTVATISVAPDVTTVTASAESTTPGNQGNGFLPGEIHELVSAPPVVLAAVNTEISQGGSDVETDDRYRYRIYLAPSKFSVAGPYEAYEYWTLTANGAITTASVWSPAPNDISICALLTGGEPAGDAIKADILTTLSDDKVRPLGDRITVEDAASVPASGSFSLEIYNDYQAMASNIEAQFRTALNATLATWREQLGRDIVPEALTKLGQSLQGVYRCTTTLTFQGVAQNQNPIITVDAINVSITTETSLGG